MKVFLLSIADEAPLSRSLPDGSQGKPGEGDAASRAASGAGVNIFSHSERLFFVIDAFSRWPDVCWFGVTRSELITNRTNHDLRRASFVLVPSACGVIGGERHVIHALCVPGFMSSCSVKHLYLYYLNSYLLNL